MTVTYDPKHPKYFDEKDMREELERVYDLCHGCRLCLNLCPSFPTLFNAVDAHDGDVAKMTIPEQDQVVDECYQCKLCYVKCPYVPPHEWELDFPRLMLRAEAVRNRNAIKDKNPSALKDKVTNQVLGRTDLMGKAATLAPQLANATVGKPGSPVRKVMEKTVGVAAERVLPPYSATRFSTWFKRHRPGGAKKESARKVALFPTCLVEYSNPDIGKDMVKVYERNGVSCSLPEGERCCGAPWLHSGEFDTFVKQGEHNVKLLAEAVRTGNDVVVPQPTCGYVLKRDYPEYIDSDDARLVAEHTYDASEYLWKMHKDQLPGDDHTEIDTEFSGEVPAKTAYHVPCHLQAQNIGLRSRDLLKLTGTKVKLVNKCSGIDGMWGFRAENYDLSRKVVKPLVENLEDSDADVVAGDCHLANGAIDQETGKKPRHPLQQLARAYGIPEESD